MSETVPGNVYDPSKPYQAPDSSALPPITAPPQIADRSTLQQQPGPAVLPKSSPVARAAYGLDSILKGYMRGREQAQENQAYKLNRLIQGYQWQYQNAKKQYLGMLQNDPALAAKIGELNSKTITPERKAELSKDPDVVAAQQASAGADSAWAAMQKIYGNYIDPQKKTKSGKSSKSKGGDQSSDQSNPIQMAQSQDPQEKAKGLYQIWSRIGPDYKIDERYLTSEQYRKQQQLATGEQRIAGDVQQKRIDLHDLQNMDPATMTPEQKSKLERLRTDPELFPKMSGPDKKIHTYPGADGKDRIIWQRPDESTYETMAEDERRKPVSETKLIRAWSKDKSGRIVSVDVDPQTNQTKPGTENYDLVPPPGMLEHVRTGEFSWQDADGNLHRTQTTTTTTPVVPSPGGPHATGATGSGTGADTAKRPRNPTPAPLGLQTPAAGDRIVGNVGAKGQAKSRAEAADSVLTILPSAKEMLNNPDVRKNLGVFNGRWSEIEKKVGSLDPKTQEFYGTLKSIYALNGAMHGWRSIKAPEEFQKAYGDLHTDPDTLLGGLAAVDKTARAVYQTGFHHPYGSTTGIGGVSTPGTVDPNDPGDILGTSK